MGIIQPLPPPNRRFAGPMAQLRERPRVYVFGCLVEPPTPSRRALGPKSVRVKACHGALGGPFFIMFLSEFGFNFELVWGKVWARLWLVLVAF